MCHIDTKSILTNNNVVVIPYTPCLLNLGPCDFALFPKLQMKLKGRLVTVSDKRYSTALRKIM
jgi:hypothetical protein